ncbi:MAG: HAMP domain-containing sensor histidine kinase [Cytophagales bacterium]
MNKKLLYKTLRVYIVYSVLVILFTVPLFYYIIEGLNIKYTDESLKSREKDFNAKVLPLLKTDELSIWNEMNQYVKIEPMTIPLNKDTLFTLEDLNESEHETERYRVLKTPIKIEENAYLFVSRINLMESEDLLENIAILFIVILILLLSGLYVITKIMSLKLWSPFYNALKLIEGFEVDKYMEPKFISNHVEEFERLNGALGKLFQKNVQIYNSQREFVENAAHELQTPLAIFQAKIEMLSQHPDLTETQSKILEKLIEVMAKFSRLNRNLLLLSKLESGIFASREQVNLKYIIEKQLLFFQEQGEELNLKIVFDCEKDFLVMAHMGLVEILISNMFLNAISHNISNGWVRITVNGNTLIFENTGIELPIEPQNLFLRFAKGKHNNKGNGLGLAIVKKIIDQHAWKIHYEQISNLHVFKIEF